MDDKNMSFVEGRNAVLELLKTDRDVDKVYIQKGEAEGSINKIKAICKDKGIAFIEIPKNKLDEMSETKKHQGVIAIASAVNYALVSDIIKYAKEKNEPPFILILDGITDPHNFGAILRSAECAGVHGVIIPKRRSASLSGIVTKTSAGAYLHVPVAKVSNIAQTIDMLKKEGVWVYCTDLNGKTFYEEDMKGPIALVIGSEGDGVSKLVKEKCDFAVTIPMFGQVSSLNASVAAGLIIYEVVRQRKYKS